MMRKFLPVIALSGLLGFTACTDMYGNYDPVATNMLAAGALAAAAGVAVGVAASQPSRGYYYGRPYGYGYGHRPPPRYYGRPYYYR